MKTSVTRRGSIRVAAWLIPLLASTAVGWAQHEGAHDASRLPADPGRPAAVRLWDTGSPLHRPADASQRSGWRALSGDAPGRLRGDLVLETDALAAAFASELGRVLLYSKSDQKGSEVELLPAELKGKRATIASTKVAVHESGFVTVETAFCAAGESSLPIAFSFAGDRTLTVTPQGSTRGVSIIALIDYALVPSFVGDDLVYDPRHYPSAKTLSVPSEHVLLGLMRGESSMLVMTWQEHVPSVQLALDNAGPGTVSISAVSFVGGGCLSLAVLDAPGIWHRESLEPAMLERDVPIAWKPPFSAVWLTQLHEDEVATTFEFRDGKEETWRGGVGNYTYPTWFSGGKTMLSLGKKIPPEGAAVIYFLEQSEDTPQDVLSPIDVVQRTLTGEALAGVLDVVGRQTWFPERPNAVIGAATCAVTDALKEIFNSGREVEEQAVVKGGVEDMYFYLERMFEQDARFYPFANDMIAYLDAERDAKPESAPFLQGLRSTAQEMVAEYDHARDTIRDMDWAHALGARTIALAAERRPDNPQRMADLKQDWTSMGGALEELARREHTLTRKLYQQAGYGAAVVPTAMPVAEEIRKLTKQCLERPEDYEIWANY